MTRLFIDQELSASSRTTLDGDVAHYLLRVMRCEPGDALRVVDAGSREYEARVLECAAQTVDVQIGEALATQTDPRVELTLYQALLKGKHFELVVQKCTELGVSHIVPVTTERTIVRLDPDDGPNRRERWERIAKEAARQCGRTRPPVVAAPMDWREALSHWRETAIPGVIPYEALAGVADQGFRGVLSRIGRTSRLAAFVGPEGGFSPIEADEAVSAGLHPVSLGPRILRAETAAIAVCTIAIYELETEI